MFFFSSSFPAGLRTQGVYRLSGVKSRVEALKVAYNNGEMVNLKEQDASTVTSLLKQYLRELPETVLTNALTPVFEHAAGMNTPTLAFEHKQQQVWTHSYLSFSQHKEYQVWTHVWTSSCLPYYTKSSKYEHTLTCLWPQRAAGMNTLLLVFQPHLLTTPPPPPPPHHK